MTRRDKEPYFNIDDNQLLGFVANDGTSWQALTIFGYQISRGADRKHVESVLNEQGLSYLTGIWQYYDKDDKDWFPCVIKKAYEQKVLVNRTNVLGFQDPDDYKQVLIEDPSENNLIKSS